MRRVFFPLIASLIVVLSVPPARVSARFGTLQQAAPPRSSQVPPIAARTAGMQKIDGFFPLYWDDATGSLFLEIPKLDVEVLYQTGIGAGMGSNDIGLDRGLLVDTKIVSFQRIGPKVLMVQPNYDFRALSTSADERRAVDEAGYELAP